MNSRQWWIGAVAATLSIPALSGCGAVSSAVNSTIPEINNIASLDNTEVDAVIGSGRAVISSNFERSVTFADRELPQRSKLRRLKLRQSIDPAVSVTLPNRAIMPESFQLSNIALSVTLTDGTGTTLRTASASSSVTGPITFTRVGTSIVYRASGPVEVSNITFEATNFSTARDIITTTPTPNTVDAKLSFDADDTQLPRGTILRFKFINGVGKVEI